MGRPQAELANRITSVGPSEVTEGLETACWELLWPLVVPTIQKAPKQLDEVKERPYSCWTHELKPKSPRRVGLHFSNAYQPESPFRERRGDLIDSLGRLLEDVRTSQPGVDRVLCGSWLNQFEPFQALFPPAWKSSFTPTYDYWGTYGWWGQYMRHDGGFHQPNGNLLRLHRRHLHTAGNSECAIQEAIDHREYLTERE